MANKIFLTIATLLVSIFGLRAQFLEGNITYNWDQPQKIILSGPIRPVVSLGDRITITISGKSDLRPYEVEKKRGGFLGIGSKRYREVVHNEVPAGKLKIYTDVEGTNWHVSSKDVNRQFKLNVGNLEDKVLYDGMKWETAIRCFLDEPNKNYTHGSANLVLNVEIDTKGRIPYVIQHLKEYPVDEAQGIKDLLDIGNLMKQYPDEMCDELFKFYNSDEQKIHYDAMKTSLLAYLLMKSPNNEVVRLKLTESYLSNGNFAHAKQSAKEEIAKFKNKGLANLKPAERITLASYYFIMAEVAATELMGTQANAFSLAISFYNLAEEQFLLGGALKRPQYRELVASQAKAYQRVGTQAALLEAAKRLENYLQKTK